MVVDRKTARRSSGKKGWRCGVSSEWTRRSARSLSQKKKHPRSKAFPFVFLLCPLLHYSHIQLLVQNSNNSLDTYLVPSPIPSHTSGKSKPTPSEPTKTHSVDIPGHRSDVRALCLSSDDQLICSASHGTLKLWNARTTQCLRTMECGYALCAAFLPGDRHVVVGLKSGHVALYDVQSSTLLHTYAAHGGPVWSLHVRPDGKGLVSGSADKDVKFWEFEMREVEEEGEDGATVDRLGRQRKVGSLLLD